MAKANKRTALEALTNKRLAKLVSDFGLEVSTSTPKHALVDALARARHPSLAEVLEQLNRDELKDICQAHGLDGSGEKAAIIAVLLGVGEAPAQEVTSSSQLRYSPGPEHSVIAAESETTYSADKSPPPWLATLYDLVDQDSIDPAIDLLFDHINDLLFEDRAADCDGLLQQIDVARLDTNLLVSLLSVTSPARAVLPSRTALVERVERRLNLLAPTRVARLLSGLR